MYIDKNVSQKVLTALAVIGSDIPIPIRINSYYRKWTVYKHSQFGCLKQLLHMNF